MKTAYYLATTLLATAFAVPAHAQSANEEEQVNAAQETAETPAPAAGRAFSTGVAKGRDLLNTAISASVIDETALNQISANSVVGIMQNIPGLRAETSDIDGFSAITVRGLPLAAEGSKYLQLQEDGLPVLEFGDLHFASADQFLRSDLSLAQVQAIRGGSASTFASNAPGGVVNFISNTGEVEGGRIELSGGIGHDLNRIDFAYGSPLGDGWRFHVGGFYRQGEGARNIGYTGFRGGQLRFNITKQLDNGYVRLYAKYLDDRQPNHSFIPVSLTGTNEAPIIADLPGIDALQDGYGSALTAGYAGVDQNNNPTTYDSTNGLRAVVKAIGLEAQFEVAGFTVTDRFRFASIGGEYNESLPMLTAPAGLLGMIIGGPGATLTYQAGPDAGDLLNPAALAAVSLRINATLNNIDNVTNDLRATRVWQVGNGNLTTTAGLYASSQTVDMYWNFGSTLNDLAGGGKNMPLTLTSGGGVPLSDAGVYAYGFGLGLPIAAYHNLYDLNYDVLAPYGSLNYMVGKLAIGASVRFDQGNVGGTFLSASFGGGRPASAPIDVNGDGQISVVESNVAILPLGQPAPVDYGYNYVSYSGSVNYRLAESLSVFARYSRGARASAERNLGAASLNVATGSLYNPALAYSPVKQAEGGIKFRRDGLAAYVTAFWASTSENNVQIGADATGQPIVISIDRTYSAKGIEIEAEYSSGPFSLTVGGTWTNASIDKDRTDPAMEGSTPRHIPDFSFQARPVAQFDLVTLGAVINGTTSSYAQDTNLLKQPGYVLVSPFVQIRPTENLELALNVFNAFDTRAIVQISTAAVTPDGLANIQVMNGRTATVSLRYSF